MGLADGMRIARGSKLLRGHLERRPSEECCDFGFEVRRCVFLKSLFWPFDQGFTKRPRDLPGGNDRARKPHMLRGVFCAYQHKTTKERDSIRFCIWDFKK